MWPDGWTFSLWRRNKFVAQYASVILNKQKIILPTNLRSFNFNTGSFIIQYRIFLSKICKSSIYSAVLSATNPRFSSLVHCLLRQLHKKCVFYAEKWWYPHNPIWNIRTFTSNSTNCEKVCRRWDLSLKYLQKFDIDRIFQILEIQKINCFFNYREAVQRVSQLTTVVEILPKSKVITKISASPYSCTVCTTGDSTRWMTFSALDELLLQSWLHQSHKPTITVFVAS